MRPARPGATSNSRRWGRWPASRRPVREGSKRVADQNWRRQLTRLGREFPNARPSRPRRSRASDRQRRRWAERRRNRKPGVAEKNNRIGGDIRRQRRLVRRHVVERRRAGRIRHGSVGKELDTDKGDRRGAGGFEPPARSITISGGARAGRKIHHHYHALRPRPPPFHFAGGEAEQKHSDAGKGNEGEARKRGRRQNTTLTATAEIKIAAISNGMEVNAMRSELPGNFSLSQYPGRGLG